MKALLIFAAAILGAGFLHAQETSLSVTDRELLLERLREIQETSDTTVKGRFGVAIAAFREGMQSDAAAHDLYLKCIEKVRFEDQARKTNEFREWKREHKDRIDTPGLRRAFRHQLYWLVLTLEAAQNKEAISKMGSRGIAVLEAILKDATILKGQQKTLGSDALGSVFAIAYGIDEISVQNWPSSPLDIATIYDVMVFPSLRTPEKLSQLRQSWLKRIEHEGLILENWTDEGSDGKDRKPAFEKWLVDGRQELTWAMDVDLFNHGDQRGAALRMLEHLKKNLGHQSAPKWIGQFTNLVKGEAQVSEKEEEE